MAQKLSKTTTKNTRTTEKPSSKAKVAAAHKPEAKPAGRASAAKASGKRSPAKAERSSGRSSSASRAQSPRTHAPKAQAPRPGLSLDRKLDMLGIFLALVGGLTLLAMLSPANSFLTLGWINAISTALGLGVYIFPFCLIVGGVWLVLRNFERIPRLPLERGIGFLLLLLNLLAGFHLAVGLASRQDSYVLARAGQGGGYLGAVILEGLKTALGIGGAVIALGAWLVIAIMLTLDVSALDLVRWFPTLLLRLQSRFEQRMANRATGKLASGAPDTSSTGMESAGAYPEFSPLPRAGDEMETAAGTLVVGPAAPSAAPAAGGEPVWALPSLDDILESGAIVQHDQEQDDERAQLIEETLASFGAPANVVEINRGPTITQFGVEPDFIETRTGRMRVRVSKIASLADDLALALSARTIRIQAPVPGKSYVGIEVPNDEIGMVALRDVIESEAFKRLKSPLRFALGQNVAGRAVAGDLASLPHLLVAGATGSGKSVFVNALITCLLMNNTPDDLRLIMVDPKRVELTGYNGIPHLLAPVVVEVERVVSALQWVTREMDLRYRKLAEAGSRNIQDYNARQLAKKEKKLPYLVVIIDELADLMMLAPDETERSITRLAQLARATGIHLVIATQRPSVDVVTGLIKANLPARLAFAVASGVDSRVILDQPGAERLLGRGDMLFQAPDAPAPARMQGVYVSDAEIQRLVSYWQGFAVAAQPAPPNADGMVDALPAGIPLKQIAMWDEIEQEEPGDPLLPEAIDLSRRQGRASISMLQRRLRIGYTRAARLVETMETKGIVGPPDPSTGTREILDYGPAAPPVEERGD